MKLARGQARTYHKDRAATGAERKRRAADKATSIDGILNEALKGIDVKRRKRAETSLAEWVKTYGVPLLLQDQPPPLGVEVLNQMERTITAHQKYMICLSRGSGKTSYT